MSSLDTTAYGAMLQSLYPDEEVENAAFQPTKLAKRIKKIDDFYGDGTLKFPLQYAAGAGRSSTFATAQANSSAAKRAGWVLTRKVDYVVYSQTTEVIMASSRDSQAFASSTKAEMDMQLSALGQSFSNKIYGDGTVGTIAAGGISGATATLTFGTDVKNFYPGQKVQLSATTSGGAVKAGGPLTVLGVSRAAGTVTFTAGIVATVGTAVPGDFIFVDGDYGTQFSGLKLWLPLVAPSATPFNGVDRSVDVDRLSGARVNNPNGDPAENLISLGQLVAAGNPGPKQLIVINTQHYGNIVKSLGSKVTYMRNGTGDSDGKMLMGATGAFVGLSSGMAEIFVDPDCPGGQGWILDEDVIEFHSMGKVPNIIDSDGNLAIRLSNADAVETRASYFGDLFIKNPYKCGTFATPV